MNDIIKQKDFLGSNFFGKAIIAVVIVILSPILASNASAMDSFQGQNTGGNVMIFTCESDGVGAYVAVHNTKTPNTIKVVHVIGTRENPSLDGPASILTQSRDNPSLFESGDFSFELQGDKAFISKKNNPDFIGACTKRTQ